MGHGFVVPLVAIWIVWREHCRWRHLPFQSSWMAVPALLSAAALHLAGALGAGLFVQSVGLLFSLLGLILCFGGLRLARAWAFPILLLIFMLPKLAIVYNQVTLPLQLLATRAAAGMLSVVGFSVVRQGNILDVRGHRIAVVEACNGVRYLLPLAFMAVVFAYLAGGKVRMRLTMLISAVPIAILANALRVALSGASPVLAEGAPHMLVGVLIYLLCLAALALAYQLFNKFEGHLA